MPIGIRVACFSPIDRQREAKFNAAKTLRRRNPVSSVLRFCRRSLRPSAFGRCRCLTSPQVEALHWPPFDCRKLPMTQKITPSTVLFLTFSPLLWAGNAVVGRTVNEMVPPVTLNLLRWTIAMLILLPLASRVFRRGSALWPNWKRFSLLGLLGVGLYNTLQYLALHTSSPINVTLVAASMPVWMML